MPQSGDGDLWPTTDDDTSSTPAQDTETHELPVPDQQKQSESPDESKAGAAETPEPGAAEAADERRDEPHAKPEQQITQPVSWPVADLERQTPAEDPVRSFSRPLPTPADEKTAIVKRPAWPAASQDNEPKAPAAQPDSSDEGDSGSREPARPEETSRDDSQPGAGTSVAWPESGRDDPQPKTQESTQPAGDDAQPRPGQREDPQQSAPSPTRPGDSGRRDPQDTSPARSGESGRRDSQDAPASAARPGDSDRRDLQDAPASAARSGDSGRRDPQDASTTAARSGDSGRRDPQDAPTSAARPGDSDRRDPQDTSPARSGESGRRDPQDTSPARSGESGRRDSQDAPTSFVRPVSAPPSFLRPDNKETSFVRRQEPPGFARQENAVRPDDSATSFIRRDKSFTDSTTVNLTRPEPERRTGWPPPEPPRAAPQRIGPQPEPAEPEQRKKPRKPLLIATISIAAVIAVAAGVVFGVPGLSDRLGLTGEDPVAIAPPPAPISYSPALHGPDTATAAPTRQGVEQALAGPMANPALGNVNGIVIDPATGETLYEKNADSAITPASTGKILTAAATLLSLDPTEQLVTKVVEGDQPGEVIIVGGGDPTISSLAVGQESIYPGAPHLSELVDQVKASGAQVQTVYIDQSRYAPPGLAPSWLPADIAAGYITPIVPAMLDGDRQTEPTENYSPRTADPGRTLVDEFASRIGASPAGSIEKKAPENAKVLGEIRSAPMTQLVDNMLNRSENTLADVLAHEVAIKAGEVPNFDGASKAMLDVLRENGFDVEGVVLRDGSGMSEENKMTARLLAEVLAVAASPDGKDPRTAKLRPLLGGLPVAGGSGTLADRYTEADAIAGKGWVRAKTGSLTGINSLAGIVLDKDNRPLVFAFLTSGTVATSARPALDSVTATLRGCGCQ